VILLGVVGLMAAASAADRPPSSAEARVLEQSATELEQRIGTSGLLYGDAQLDAYLQRIADELLAGTPTAPVRVHAIRSAYANAFVLPNGAVFVTTELLQRLDNEAQLACVFGHELTHYTDAHALKEWRAGVHRRRWATGLAIVLASLAAAATNSPQVAQSAAQISVDAGQLWAMAAVSGYSRELEAAADRAGLARMITAGYDPRESVHVFEHLREDQDAGETDASPYFASHPKLEQRIASFQQLLGGEYASAAAAGGRVGQEEYAGHIAGWSLAQVEVLLKANALDAAARTLQKSSQAGTARGWYLKGEIARRRPSSAATREEAIAAYAQAAAQPECPPDALRQQALLYRLQHATPQAAQAFRRYLELAPAAADAPIVRGYLEQLEATPPASADPPPSAPHGDAP
jgi:predicted Zn-dependent protease